MKGLGAEVGNFASISPVKGLIYLHLKREHIHTGNGCVYVYRYTSMHISGPALYSCVIMFLYTGYSFSLGIALKVPSTKNARKSTRRCASKTCIDCSDCIACIDCSDSDCIDCSDCVKRPREKNPKISHTLIL